MENLLVIGDGPEHSKLVDLADENKNIKFLPKYNGPEEIAKYFKASKGFIFPSLEPFGIIPVEALSCGLPILAYGYGGSLDIIENGVNGMFFDEQTVESLIRGLEKFNVAKYNRTKVAKTAERFNRDAFNRAFIELVEKNSDASLL